MEELMREVHAVRTEIAAFRAMVEMMAAEHQGINAGIGAAILAENSTIRAKSEERLFEITTAYNTLQEILDQQAGSRAD